MVSLFFVGLLSAAIFFLVFSPVLLVDIASQESTYTICSVIEAEGVAKALEVAESMALVVWGEPGTLGTSFDQLWSAAERAIWVIDRVPPYLLGVIVGLILSDGNLSFSNHRNLNARLLFKQSMSHFPYFWFVFWLCAPLCQSMFKFGTSIRKGTVCNFIRFHTRCLPVFTELYNLFYVNGVKCIPAVEIMYYLLTPIALAHMICGDGLWNRSGLILCTDSFSIIDNVKLINILMNPPLSIGLYVTQQR